MGLKTESRAIFGRLPKSMTGFPAMAFIPAGIVMAYILGGEGAMFAAALGLPLACFLIHYIDSFMRGLFPTSQDEPLYQGLKQREDLELDLDIAVHEHRTSGPNSCCFVIELDNFEALKDQSGPQIAHLVFRTICERLCGMLRDRDVVARISATGFGISCQSPGGFDAKTAAALAQRIQKCITTPISVDDSVIVVSCSLGYCLSAQIETSGKAFLNAALMALTEARQNGNGTIRNYSKDFDQQIQARDVLTGEIARALDIGQIIPWFQPQVDANTGAIIGFEALARWQHPIKGIIPPLDFLHAAKQAGVMENLRDVMIKGSLDALKTWDRAGMHVPSVGVNFSASDLADPLLVDKIQWHLDAFDMPANRLTIEVLESVIATTQDDTIIQNIATLSDLGCEIDLDDFGTGHASITSLRQFKLSRIKVDRSFVTDIHKDSEKQKMMATILMMTQRMGMESLAEGVENNNEMACLAELGCGALQGFGIGKPMPLKDTLEWLSTHQSPTQNTLLAG